ncbi:MAG: acylphosphatase [Acidimicrobiales bacterium]
MADDTIRRRVLVEGRVQGVFFRDTCRRQASVHGVAGWARNTADGRVEVVVEGPASGVARMVEWCRTGPFRADVQHAEVHEEQPEGLTGFSIR